MPRPCPVPFIPPAKSARLASLLLAAVLVLGCARLTPPPSANPSSPQDAVQMDTPFQLPLEGTATLSENLSLTFERVEQDSRCPLEVACVWPGQAEIIVAVSQGGQPATTVSLIQRAGDEAAAMQSVNGLTVKLLELAPYPTAESSPTASYTATLVITQP